MEREKLIGRDEISDGVIKFSLKNVNFEVLVKNNKVIDFIVEETEDNFSKIYFCHNNMAENEMTAEEYKKFERRNYRIIDFISEIYINS